MGRPQKVIQQKKNGIYFVQLHIDGRRVTKSLETKDQLKATQRASQAIRELQAEAERQGQSKWLADEPVTVWDIPTKADGSNDYENAVSKQLEWSEVATNEDEIRSLTWNDLVKEAVRVRQQKEGKDYSEGWYVSARQAITRAPFTPLEATPELIRKWILSMEEEGLGARSRQLHCTTLSNLISRAQMSGLLNRLEVNPFTKVDYSTTVTNHIPPFLEADYRKLKEVLPGLSQSQRLLMLLMTYTGTRISEYLRRGADAFDLEAGTITIEGKVKNKSSERTLPLPAFLVEELKGFDFKWNDRSTINSKIKLVNETLSSHSFRHGLVRLGREVGAAADPIEAFCGHKLKGMKAVYGDGFSVEAFREAVNPLWTQLDQWVR